MTLPQWPTRVVVTLSPPLAAGRPTRPTTAALPPPKREQVVRRQTGLPLLAQHDAVAAEEQPTVRMCLRQVTTRIVRGWSGEWPVLTKPD